MNMIRFINELAANVGIGAGEKRFARDLARSPGFRVHEPEHGGSLTPSTTPPPAPASTPKKSKPYSASFEAGVEHGRTWGFNRAYRSDLQRLAEWVGDVGGDFTAQDVVAVAFPKPVGEWMKHDAERLLDGNEDFVRGFVVGGMLVWAHIATMDQNKNEG